MKAIHLICRREEDGHLKGLSLISKGTFESCCWALGDVQDAQSLIGGWVYLHPNGKSHRSEFGGVVRAVRPAGREGTAIKDGFAFVIEVRREGRDQKWRGAAHRMAWTGGIAGAHLPHEGGSDADRT